MLLCQLGDITTLEAISIYGFFRMHLIVVSVLNKHVFLKYRCQIICTRSFILLWIYEFVVFRPRHGPVRVGYEGSTVDNVVLPIFMFQKRQNSIKWHLVTGRLNSAMRSDRWQADRLCELWLHGTLEEQSIFRVTGSSW